MASWAHRSMQRVAAALRGTPEAAPGPQAVSLLPQDLAKSRLTIHRHSTCCPRGRWLAISLACSACGTRSWRRLRSGQADRPSDRVGSRGDQQRGSAALRNLEDPLRSGTDPDRAALRALESAPDSLPIEIARAVNRSRSSLAWSTRPSSFGRERFRGSLGLAGDPRSWSDEPEDVPRRSEPVGSW